MREWLSGRASPCQGECRGFESRLPLQKILPHCIFLRRYSQVVRPRSAKPLSPGSNPGGASITNPVDIRQRSFVLLLHPLPKWRDAIADFILFPFLFTGDQSLFRCGIRSLQIRGGTPKTQYIVVE